MKKQADLMGCGKPCDHYSRFKDAYGREHCYCAKECREIFVFGWLPGHTPDVWGNHLQEDSQPFPTWCKLEDIKEPNEPA